MLKIKVKSQNPLPKVLKLQFEHIRDIYYDMYICWGDEKILHRIVKKEQIKAKDVVVLFPFQQIGVH